MFLITVFVELRVVAGRTWAGSPQAISRWPCSVMALRRTAWSAWHGRGMASVNQTRPHCVNQMGKTHCKPLAARHGRGTAWARYAMCESAFSRPRDSNTYWRIKGSVPDKGEKFSFISESSKPSLARSQTHI
jgi:hypothetical protein